MGSPTSNVVGKGLSGLPAAAEFDFSGARSKTLYFGWRCVFGVSGESLLVTIAPNPALQWTGPGANPWGKVRSAQFNFHCQ
jgi:hypothetical protein